MSGAIPLTYQPPPPRRRWRRLFRAVLLLGAIAFTVYLANGQWWLHLRLQVAMLAAQRQCMNSKAPPDQVALELDPVASAKLLKRSDYRDYGKSSIFGATVAAGWVVEDDRLRELSNCWEAVDMYDFVADTSRDFDTSALPVNYPRAGTLNPVAIYLHAMHSSAGERLVAVFVESSNPGVINVRPLVWKPAGWTTMPVLLKSDTDQSVPVPGAVRFYAGQVDAADGSRLIIRCQTGSGAIRIVGRLLPDDTVKLTVEP